VLSTLVSAKGSPGVTTTAAAITAVAAEFGQSLLMEMDPAGGDLEALTGVTGEPGLLRAANDLRRQVHPEVLAGHAVEAPAGVPAILAPTAGPAAASLIGSVVDRLGAALAGLPLTVVGDGGRWEPSQPTARRIVGSQVVGVVCRPTAAGVEHARHVLDRIRELTRPVALVLVGDRPYAASEVAAALETPVAGVMAWDPSGVAALWANGASKRWQHSWLARSARNTFLALAEMASDVVATR
jgi:hypothetical protein